MKYKQVSIWCIIVVVLVSVPNIITCFLFNGTAIVVKVATQMTKIRVAGIK
jgi:hypothetical protein